MIDQRQLNLATRHSRCWRALRLYLFGMCLGAALAGVGCAEYPGLGSTTDRTPPNPQLDWIRGVPNLPGQVVFASSRSNGFDAWQRAVLVSTREARSQVRLRAEQLAIEVLRRIAIAAGRPVDGLDEKFRTVWKQNVNAVNERIDIARSYYVWLDTYWYAWSLARYPVAQLQRLVRTVLNESKIPCVDAQLRSVMAQTQADMFGSAPPPSDLPSLPKDID